LQVRPEICPDLLLPRIAETACDSPPHDPELCPHALVVVSVDAGCEEGSRLFGAPLVQGIAEAGTQRVSGQLKPDPFMVRRAASSFGSCKQRPPQFAQNGSAPLFARTERLFEAAPEAFDVCGDRSSRSRLSPENPFNRRPRLRKSRRHRFDNGFARRCRGPAQFEFEPPLLVTGIRDTPQLERADFSQNRPE